LNIKSVLQRRHNTIEIDIFKQGSNKIKIETNSNTLSLEYENRSPEAVVYLGINKQKQGIQISHLLNGPVVINQYKYSKVNFVPSGYVDMSYLSELYASLVSMGKDELVDESLKLFDDNIISIRQLIQGRPVFKVKVKNESTPILLSSLGEGINRFMAIVCAIWASENGYLFIDEIENGIHYTNYAKLWELVYKLSKEANCQVFVTTHSKECIEAFNQVNSEDQGAYFELYKNKKEKLVAKNRDHEQLSYSLSHNRSFRGE